MGKRNLHDIIKEYTPAEHPQTPSVQVTKEEPRRNDKFTKSTEVNTENSDPMSMLKRELSSPCLGLIEEYVKRCYPKSKAQSSKMIHFQIAHPNIFKTAILIDILLRLVVIIFVIFVAARGLGIIDIIAQLSCKK